ncbi:MAG: BREX system P-loop protein BrxC [Candidatus Wallbacteria bacterium HGW-Wallbacteria-1]|jgi:hypothetical protein|uniref:BREX system P-loop protein BrxC n=1 Tax=Candidatus Wallbacteria bacterium HGW-Wallbacteria-1 TaxID=2013854 RepID=A0A2N1PP19_9BACT|nr:MAG: BREX system P-loop protein BrxC [Candidatus Wallbacteria bacterium HGW-Wallbacteria-1]
MKIGQTFKKPIHRSINGVIKVEQHDTEVVFQELSEYVLTGEVEAHFETLIRAYNRCLDGPTDKIGVWISGFFGSGKSHFIKMLSYLMQNIDVEGLKALEFFKEKIKDPMVVGDIERAVNTGSIDVILFNIDSKSDNRMHGSQDAIVQVFMKAFNEHLGYCAEIPWLAELERQLEDKGQYEDFKSKFQEITGIVWEEGRDAFHFERDNIIQVLSSTTKMSEESAGKWFDAGEANYAISVEKFARIVKAYCDKKGRNHRVIFLVDEVGQYIGDNRELMLNLQTVVEDLGLHLKGKAWVMVTSQEAIDSITVIKGDDFSKIRGRFSTNITLSSDNTDEVIKKRLLEKEDTAIQHLKAYWSEISSMVKNLFTFSAGTAEMKHYSDRDDFVDVYPFVPYQFNLLQKVLEQVRRIGATGAHLSEGERSMLSAFQEAAMAIADSETGNIIPFHYFYGSIEAFLHGGIKRTINQAKTNSNLREEDCDLLKTLFMIKYIKEVRPNLENLTTLSLTSITQDKMALRNSIQKSLERLVAETLVHQNGDEFEFLTNEEQDITRKIKAVKIEQESVIHHVGDVIFSDIYPETRYKMSVHNSYGVNKQVDNINKGSQGNEMTLKVITPWCDDPGAGQLAFAQMSSAVIVALPDDQSYLEDIKEMLQIERFCTRESNLTNSDTIRSIISDKSRLAAKLKSRVYEAIKDAIIEAEFTVMGQKESIRKGEPKTMINEAMGKLAENVYPKRDYVKEHTPYIEDIKSLLNKDDLTLFNEAETGQNKEAWREIMDHVQVQAHRMMAITVKTLQDKFMKSPYGWAEMDLGGLLASLFAQGRLRFKYNGEFIKDTKELPNQLTNKRVTEKVQVEPKAEIDEAILMNARKTLTEAFGTSNLPEGVEGLYKEAQSLIRKELYVLNKFEDQYRIQPAYPGKDICDKGVALLESLLKKDDEIQLFTFLISSREELEDLHEDMRDMKSFFNNQADIFDQAVKGAKTFDAEKDFMDDESRSRVEEIQNIIKLKNPYGRVKDLPELLKAVKESLQQRLDELRRDMVTKVQAFSDKIKKETAKVNLREKVKLEIEDILNTLRNDIGSISDCHRMMAYQLRINKAGETIYLLIDQGAVEPEVALEAGSSYSKTVVSAPAPKKKTIQIGLRQYSGTKITSLEEMNRLINRLREDIKEHLDEGHDVRLM